MRIAIIGMGTAGVSLLKELVKQERFSELAIDVYDNPKNMGQGVPFQNDSDQLKINQHLSFQIRRICRGLFLDII